jgi:flavin reductase (DIM6/NTAB) family NADH-FMN oxidoreductase RutF
MDTRELRHAFGRFPTGVSVLAARDSAGELVGLTANSVIPVSCDPPRLMWSLLRSSRSRAAFEAAEYFSVNVLGETQAALARRMAGPGDRFADLTWEVAGHTGLPLFAGCVAWFECARIAVYEAGDHLSFIGEVMHHHRNSEAPLLYAGGAFGRLTQERRQAAA